jgi:hypothetical protein
MTKKKKKKKKKVKTNNNSNRKETQQKINEIIPMAGLFDKTTLAVYRGNSSNVEI